MIELSTKKALRK